MDTPHHNSTDDGTAALIEARLVDDSRRLSMLPHYFGRQMMMFENAVYNFMHRFAPDYRGGLWQFYELSNGGFYMAPDRESVRFLVDTNGYEGVLSANAAGIIVCLFACNHLSLYNGGDDLFADRFHQLRDFALQHSEAAEIFAAID